MVYALVMVTPSTFCITNISTQAGMSRATLKIFQDYPLIGIVHLSLVLTILDLNKYVLRLNNSLFPQAYFLSRNA